MKHGLITATALVLLLGSCTVRSRTASTTTMNVHGLGVIQNPVIAELDVQELKVNGTATGRKRALSLVKESALADAIAKANADVLVQPSYVLETVGARTTVTVTGFPATYKNFRNATSADSSLIRAGYAHPTNVATSGEALRNSHPRKGALGIVLGILLIGAAIVIPLLAG